MAGEDVEVAVEVAHVDGLVRHRLGTIDEDGDVPLMGERLAVHLDAVGQETER